MTEIDLLPCPFCGGEAFLQDDVVNGYTDLDRFCGVSCTDCYAMVDACYETAMEAVQAWNTRAELGAATLDGGRLTAEQVGKAMFRNCVWDENSAMYYVGYTDMQAIADELNAALGGGECENVSYRVDESRFHCSSCGFGCWVKNVATGRDELPAHCPNCGKKVVER